MIDVPNTLNNIAALPEPSNFIDFVPKPVLSLIFSYLPPDMQPTLCQVNKKWNMISSSDMTWKAILQSYGLKTDDSDGISAKESFKIQTTLDSTEKIVDLAERTLKRIQVNTNYKFSIISNKGSDNILTFCLETGEISSHTIYKTAQAQLATPNLLETNEKVFSLIDKTTSLIIQNEIGLTFYIIKLPFKMKFMKLSIQGAKVLVDKITNLCVKRWLIKNYELAPFNSEEERQVDIQNFVKEFSKGNFIPGIYC